MKKSKEPEYNCTVLADRPDAPVAAVIRSMTIQPDNVEKLHRYLDEDPDGTTFTLMRYGDDGWRMTFTKTTGGGLSVEVKELAK